MDNMIYKPLPYPQSLDSAHYYFYQHGITMTAWAKSLDISIQAVRDILSRRSVGRSGKSHTAAVALGLKKAPEYL